MPKQQKIPAIARVSVTSTSIAQVGYDGNQHLLDIKFHNGQVWRYEGVANVTFDEMMAAASIGKFFSTKIRGHYAEQRLADETA